MRYRNLPQRRSSEEAWNYRAWSKWEKAQDFASVMLGRYHTRIEKREGTPVVLSLEGDNATTGYPLPEYWVRRLHDDMALSDRATRGHPMELVKVIISKNALIDTYRLDKRLSELGIDPEDVLKTMRVPTDNVRLALTYTLRNWQHFVVDGLHCWAQSTRSKDGTEHVAVKCVSWDKVEHTQSLCKIRSTTAAEQKAGAGLVITEYDVNIPRIFRELTTSLDACALETFGKRYYFEGHLRKLFDEHLLADACLPLWTGLRLILTQDAAEHVRRFSGLLDDLDAGSGALNILSLDNTPVNREALGRELGEQFVETIEKLTDDCGHTAPNVELIQRKYQAVQDKIDLVESVLHVELDCLDAQMTLERALGQIA